jgi:soluble lytic murein transglycosylase-like protein
MTGAKLHSIGKQVLAVALLALAVIAYLTTVISSPPPMVIKPVAPSVPAAQSTAATDVGISPDACPAKAIDRSRTKWQTPPVLLPDMAPFRGKKGDNVYDHLILRAAQDCGMDPAVIKAVIMAESGFNPQAVSRSGAQGLMQLMPRTARSLGVEDSLDPRANILAGTRYLKKLLRRFDGNLEAALAAYNAGSRNVLRHNGIPPFKTTRRYIAKIKIYYQHYRHQNFDIIS